MQKLLHIKGMLLMIFSVVLGCVGHVYYGGDKILEGKTIIATYNIPEQVEVRKHGVRIMDSDYADAIGKILVYKGEELKDTIDTPVASESLSTYVFSEGGVYKIYFQFTKDLDTMRGMFYNSMIIAVDFSNFDSSNVDNMEGLFRCCVLLKKVDCRSLRCSKVKSMASMFEKCTSLEEVNFNGCDFSEMEIMTEMFSDCLCLEKVFFEVVNCNKCKTLDWMFCRCISLPEVSLCAFSAPSVESLYKMFDMCIKLEKVDLTNFNFEKVKNCSCMFFLCYSLKYFVGTGRETSSSSSKDNFYCGNPFKWCEQLKGNLEVKTFGEFKKVIEDNQYKRCCSCCCF